jgi:hypothetical protein
MSQMPATLGLHVRDQVSGLWLAARSQPDTGGIVRASLSESCREGACCLGGLCSQTTRQECTALGGDWLGYIPCTPDPCAPPGACCINGQCSQRTEAACAASGGTFRGYIMCSNDVCGCSCPPGNLGCLAYRNISTGRLTVTGSGSACVRCQASGCSPYMQAWEIDHTVQLPAIVTGNQACFVVGENTFIDPVPFSAAAGPCAAPAQGQLRVIRSTLAPSPWRVTPNFYLGRRGTGTSGCTSTGLVNNVETSISGTCAGVTGSLTRTCPVGILPGNPLCPGNANCPGGESGTVSFVYQRFGILPCQSSMIAEALNISYAALGLGSAGCSSCSDGATGGLTL